MVTSVGRQPALGLGSVEDGSLEGSSVEGEAGEKVRPQDSPQEDQSQSGTGLEGHGRGVLLEPQDPAPAADSSRGSNQGIRVSLSFEDQAVLRATSIRNILHKGGVILEDSTGTEDTYHQSNVAKMIDVFVSHNWAVPRREKFWALALHFNVGYAAAASYVGVALGCCLNALALPPTMQNQDLVMRPYCLICGSCAFFLALLLGHEVPLMGRLLCRRRLFLDKVCIHQTDPTLKAAGIRNLGAFLRHSDRMLVLFHAIYVQKLWTVYELACFMYLHRRDKLDLLPLGIARVALQCTGIVVIVFGLFMIGFHLGAVLGSAIRFVAIASISGPCLVALTFILRASALQQSALFDSLRSFRIAEAQCADESDRPVVSSNICSFVRNMGLAEDGASDEEVLLSFDKLVQERMPELLRSAVGRTGLPYKYAVLASSAIGYYTFDMISSQQDPPTSLVLAWLMYGFNMLTGVIPSAFLISAWGSNKCPQMGRWAERALTVGIAALAITGMMSAYLVTAFFRTRAVLNAWWLLPYAVVSAVEALVLARLF